MSVLRKHVEEALECINNRIAALKTMSHYDPHDENIRYSRLRELRTDRDLIKVALAGED